MKSDQQTEIGVIPQDWRVSSLGRLIRSVEYGSAAKSNINGQIPVLRMGNLQAGKLIWNDLVYTDNPSEIKKYKLYPGDVLFNRTNTIELVGKTAIYQGEQPAIFAGYLIRINVDPELLDSRFLNYILNAEFSRKYSAKVLSVAVGQANINGQKLKSYPIPLPPIKEEQEAIADTLSDADTLIESLEQLIAKKRQVKQGAMQELLTGKKRLPGFETKPGYKNTEMGLIPEDWEVKHLHTLADKIMVGIASAATHAYRDQGIIMFRNQNIKPGYLDDSDIIYIAEDYEETFKNKRLKSGDLLTARTGYPGTTSIVPRYYEGTQSFTTLITRPRHTVIDSAYLCCFINSETGQNYFTRNQIGGGQKNVNAGSLKYLPVPIPPTKKEQESIAAILSNMDEEITTLEKKLEKARQLKQGMMQELLTGRIRLVSPKPNIASIPMKKEESAPEKTTSHNWQINEAVIIGVLAKHFGSKDWPLTRFRYTKLSYLLHRYREHQAKGYLKKAAGPYNPATRYNGPEKIAQKNAYVRVHKNGKYSGFIAADNIAQAEKYFEHWYGSDVLGWLEQFRYHKNDELELLTTVDMAMEELVSIGKAINLVAVKKVIEDHPEWEAKLERETFSDANITRATGVCRTLFAA